MGQDATATLSEIEAARQRLEKDVDELDRRARPEHDLPEQARRVGVATIAAGSGVALLVAIVRWRLHVRSQHRHARHVAETVADVLQERGGTAVRARPLGDPADLSQGDPADLSQEARNGAVMLAAAAAMGGLVARLAGRGA